MHVVIIPGSYHTAAYPINMVMLAIFLGHYISFRVPELDDPQEFGDFHLSPIDFSRTAYLGFM